ncbi:MAG: LacI family DNA-binding transcriptional regulator [Chloroflexota bacterium]|nr:LacI family DNA-binding transcriptional regulator [Chloroflexota bacterium]
MATIKEVAEQAGVSVATVSRVVNKSGYVSIDLQERVRSAMVSLNYKPSALARSLRRQETQTVGVLVPQLDQPFFSALAFAVEKTLFTNAYRSLVCSSEEDRDKEDAYIDMLMRQRVDGVVIAPTGHSTENIYRLLDSNIAVVLVDRDLTQVKVNRVLSANGAGAIAGARHLIDLGHRRIALVGASMHSESMHYRLEGAKEAIIAAGGEIDPDLIVLGVLPHFEMGYTAGVRLLSGDPVQRPTAVFALTDVMAIGVMHAAAELGMSLPKDLSIIGFDDIPAAKYIIPELTTVNQPIYQMGEVAATTLIRHIHDRELPLETLQLPTRLIIRKSTAPIYP